MPLEAPAATRLFDSCAPVRAPRRANARPRLCAIFVMALGAVISGAEGGEDMAEDGQAQAQWCPQFRALPPGIPSPDTLRRGLSRLTPDALTPCLVRWTEARHEALDGDSVARDGTTLRPSVAQAASQGAIHLVRAGANAHRLV